MAALGDFRKRVARSTATTFRLRARQLAAGWASGAHRATRKGAGIEFAGHRAYTPGDDLRHLDHHALLRHGKLLVREFHTDTERVVHLLVDVTHSMDYRGAPGKKGETSEESKKQRALVLAGAIALIAKSTGDAIGLTWIGDDGRHTLPPRAGGEASARVLFELEKLFDAKRTEKSAQLPAPWKPTLLELGALLPRGAALFVLSDFLDFTAELSRELGRLGAARRVLRCAQILSLTEAEFPFEGAVRLKDPEAHREVETDAGSVRKGYLEALETHTRGLAADISSQGGSLTRHLLPQPSSDALRQLVAGNLS